MNERMTSVPVEPTLPLHPESARIAAALRDEAQRRGKGVPTDLPGFHKDLWTAAEIIDMAEEGRAFDHQMNAMLTAAPVREEGGAVLADACMTVARTYAETGDDYMVDLLLKAGTILATREEAPAEAGEASFWFDPRDPEVTDTNPDNILIGHYAAFDVTMIQCGDMAMFGFWFEPADGSEFQYRYFSDRDQADAEALAQEAALRAQPPAREDAQPLGCFCDEADCPSCSSINPAPDALRDAMAAIRAEINAPLTGPTHGAWDRGRIAGLKEALAALQAEQKGGA